MSESRPPDHTKSWISTVSADLRRAVDAEVDGLHRSLEQRIVALQDALAANDAQLGQMLLNIEAQNREHVQQAVAAARKDSEAAALTKLQESEATALITLQESEAAALTKLEELRAQLTSQLESSRSEFAAATKALESQLADAERDISTVRQQRDERAASLEEALRRVAGLEESSGQATLLRELAEAKLTEELQRRTSIEKQLEASRHELLLLKAEAESRRLEARVQDTRGRPHREPTSSPSHLHRTIGALKDGIHKMSGVRRDELLPALLEQLSSHFFAAAVFAATPQGVRLWKAHANDSSLPPVSPDAHADGDSALAKALRERSPVRVFANGPGEVLGLWKQPIRHAVALPISAQGRLVAVVYAENRWDEDGRDPETLNVVAEVLVDCVQRHLNQRPPANAPESSPAQDLELSTASDSNDGATAAAADSQAFAVSRQASRVRVNGAADVLIDGVTGTLVDISTLGAQVLCPATLRPNRSIRMVLQNGDGTISCGARVVWARLEPPKSAVGLQFRAGIQFIDIQGFAMDAFIARHRQFGPTTQHAAS